VHFDEGAPSDQVSRVSLILLFHHLIKFVNCQTNLIFIDFFGTRRDIEKFKTAHVPEFTSLVNYPSNMTAAKTSTTLPEGVRCCVMCGSACPCSAVGKNKKNKTKASGDGSLAARNVQNAEKQGLAIIPTQNKGLCTLCDVNVWIVATSGLEIKWCKGCKNFRPWAAFGDKGLATKCLRCRDRQREKYAIQKEEKERTRMMNKPNKV
jgi:Zn-finger nucleic acid-binding protein